MILSPADLYALFLGAGFSPGVEGTAVKMGAIALRESAGDPAAHNLNPATGDDSWGLTQINLAVPSIVAFLKQQMPTLPTELGPALLDPATNAKAAWILSRGFAPWAVKDLWFYRDGLQAAILETAYEVHLPAMQAAV